MPTRSLLAHLLLASSLFAAACTHAVQQPAVSKVTTPASTIDRAKLRAALAARRAITMQRFVEYREARVYPINSYKPGGQHVWLDREGHLCAAATLISRDWGVLAAKRIGLENNFIRLVDVHDGPIHDWMLTTGLTTQEIVSIQEVVVMRPAEPDDRQLEIARLYDIWTGVERALDELTDDSLDQATDALLQQPALARRVLAGQVADAGKYGDAIDDAHDPVAFAKPPA
jgi:hypothetical protein